jgi:tRNA threonylcarbamoyladenosine biosynthesis protein TsaE
MEMKITTNSPLETRQAGNAFSKILEPGDVVFFLGELGGGKTTFISGVAEGLNAAGNVSSPSFTLINIYNYRRENKEFDLVHCDLYRVQSFKDIPDIGIEGYIYDNRSIVFIEWGNFLKEKVSKDYLAIKFEYLFDSPAVETGGVLSEDRRQLDFYAKSKYWSEKINLFKDSLQF